MLGPSTHERHLPHLAAVNDTYEYQGPHRLHGGVRGHWALRANLDCASSESLNTGWKFVANKSVRDCGAEGA